MSARTIADLMLRVGDAQAAGVQARGAGTAGIVSAISRVPMQIDQRNQQAKQIDMQRRTQEAALTTEGLQQSVLRGTIAAGQRQVQDQAALDAVPMNGDEPPDFSAIPGHLRPAVEKAWTDHQEANAKLAKAREDTNNAIYDSVGAMAVAAKHATNATPEAVASLLADAKKTGDPMANRFLSQLQQDPSAAPRIVDALIQRSGKQRELANKEAEAHKPVSIGQNGLIDPVTHEVVATGPGPKTPNSQESKFLLDGASVNGDYIPGTDGKPGKYMFQGQDVTGRAKPIPPASTSNGDAGDAEAIAEAIANGDQPPVTTGLFRLAGPVRAALAKRGFNLAIASQDWAATQKHLATLNGAQQTRMAQAVDNAAHSLDVIDDLSAQWNAGKYPALNKVKLASAKQGALGPDAQKLAVALDAQIADVTSELGNVYMGGNSPTDHALSLAAKNLSADWSAGTLAAMTKQARTNLQIRQNSMKNVGVAGASATNPYAPSGGAKVDPMGLR